MDMEKGMKSVLSARAKLAHYPKAIAMCSAEVVWLTVKVHLSKRLHIGISGVS